MANSEERIEALEKDIKAIYELYEQALIECADTRAVCGILESKILNDNEFVDMIHRSLLMIKDRFKNIEAMSSRIQVIESAYFDRLENELQHSENRVTWDEKGAAETLELLRNLSERVDLFADQMTRTGFYYKD